MSLGSNMISGAATLLLVSGALWASAWPLQPVVRPDASRVEEVGEGPRADGWRAMVSQALQPRRAPAPRAGAPEPPLARYELVGVVEADSGGWGLFRGNGGLVTIPLGRSLESYTLVSLTPQTAIFERDDDRVTLSRAQR
jgi:hypothetical protein